MGSKDIVEVLKIEFTNEEYIRILQSLKDWLYLSSMNGGTRLQREAIDKAIESLSKPERIKGRWERDFWHHIKCDQCGEWMCDKDREGQDYPKNFCPNCGAKMDVVGCAEDADMKSQ